MWERGVWAVSRWQENRQGRTRLKLGLHLPGNREPLKALRREVMGYKLCFGKLSLEATWRQVCKGTARGREASGEADALGCAPNAEAGRGAARVERGAWFEKLLGGEKGDVRGEE